MKTDPNPKLIAADPAVYTWSGDDDLVHVLEQYPRHDEDGFVRHGILESYVGVSDRDIEALLDLVAGRMALDDQDDPYDLVVIRGTLTLGIVHRRPGRPSTFTRCDDRHRAAS